jgi:hypothetical protein
MDFSTHVLYCVIHHFVLEFVKALVGFQRVSEKRRTGQDMLSDFGSQGLFLGVVNHLGPYLSAALQNPHDGGFIRTARPGNPAWPFLNMHVAGFPVDVGFVRFHLPG